jgi:prevent-host-death family protein
MSDQFNTHEAKTHLSRLLERVRRGAVVTIAKAGRPVARLVPVGRSAGAGRVAERVTAPAGLAGAERALRLRRFLEQEVWPGVPAAEAGRTLSRAEEDAILGYGPEGV